MTGLLLQAAGAGALWETVGNLPQRCTPPGGEGAGLFNHQLLSIIERCLQDINPLTSPASSPQRVLSSRDAEGRGQ